MTTMAGVDLTPTDEMRLAAKAGLRRAAQGGATVLPGHVQRAKRISRGVPLEEHHVHAMDRENVGARDGIVLGEGPDLEHLRETEHLLRGGSAGADWAAEKVAELAAAQHHLYTSERSGELAPTTGMELRGLSLSEAQEARRRRMGLTSDAALAAAFPAASTEEATASGTPEKPEAELSEDDYPTELALAWEEDAAQAARHAAHPDWNWGDVARAGGHMKEAGKHLNNLANGAGASSDGVNAEKRLKAAKSLLPEGHPAHVFLDHAMAAREKDMHGEARNHARKGWETTVHSVMNHLEEAGHGTSIYGDGGKYETGPVDETPGEPEAVKEGDKGKDDGPKAPVVHGQNAMGYGPGKGTVALLPTGKNANPTKDEGEYIEPGKQTHLVMDVGEAKPRVVTTFGEGENYNVGDRMHAHHDQTFERLTPYGGGATIIGIKRASGKTEGHVPDARIPHWVFK